MKHIVFSDLKDGAMATPCAENINSMGMGYSFEVREFEADDLNAGLFGYQYRETKDDLEIVFPDGKTKKIKGKVVRLSKSKMKKIVDKREFLRKQKGLLDAAKALIGVTLINKIGSINSQLNASTATNPDIQKEWQAKFKLRDEIKFKHGKRLKDAIRNAKNLDDLEVIKISMTKSFKRWANA